METKKLIRKLLDSRLKLIAIVYRKMIDKFI